MIETPQIVETVARHYAGLHLTVPSREIRQFMGAGLREVHSAVAEQGLVPDGAWFTHHFQRPDETFDFEICVPVPAPIAAHGRVLPRVWPSMRVAQTVYQGDYAQLGAAWGEFEEWIAANGLHKAEDLWERYLVNPDSSGNPEEWRTELNRPLIEA